MTDKFTSMKKTRVDVDFAKVKGELSFRNHSLGVGGINSAPMPAEVVEGVRRLSPGLIRIFIQEFFFIEKEDGSLDFTALDRYMKAVHDTGASIMASICIKPRSLYPVVDETVWMPNDPARWQHILREMARRYSVEHPCVTHWGIGNELNIGEYGGCPYKISSPADYFEYYKLSIAPILEVFPQAKVGGPSFAGVSQEGYDFFDAFLGMCSRDGVPVDFISYNIYEDHPRPHLDGALNTRAVADRYFPGLPLYVTEMNVGLGGPSIEERAYSPKRSAGLGAIMQELHDKAPFLNTFQYHIYDQFCDPAEFAPFYSRHRYMANHWNDEPHRLGLFDLDGHPRPQYFVYQLLYSMARHEVEASCGNGRVRVTASKDFGVTTLFLTNYSPEDSEDTLVSFYFKDSPAGVARLTVERIDGDMALDGELLRVVPSEDRTTYIHDDFWFTVYVPGDSVVKVSIQY